MPLMTLRSRSSTVKLFTTKNFSLTFSLVSGSVVTVASATTTGSAESSSAGFASSEASVGTEMVGCGVFAVEELPRRNLQTSLTP